MSEEEAEALGAMIGIGLLCIGGLVVFLLPTLIAFGRGHHYKWIIFVVNVFGSTLFGAGWIAAFIWAVWPRATGVADVVLNDPTTNSPDANRRIYGRYGENVRAATESAGGSVPARRFCPHCGAPVSGGAFCAKCGGKL